MKYRCQGKNKNKKETKEAVTALQQLILNPQQDNDNNA